MKNNLFIAKDNSRNWNSAENQTPKFLFENLQVGSNCEGLSGEKIKSLFADQRSNLSDILNFFLKGFISFIQLDLNLNSKTLSEGKAVKINILKIKATRL